MISPNRETKMAVRAINEAEPESSRVLRFTPPDDVRPQDAPEQPQPKPVRPVRVVEFPTAEMVAVMSLLLKVLAARMILLFAGIGAFVLALIALQHNTIQSIITSALYDALVFAPCIYLALRREA
jgi:hypothetical protein